MTARKLAVSCLVQTAAGGFSNLVFKQQAAQAGLDSKDTAFAAALFYGALERQVTLDYILARFSAKPLEKLDSEVLAILRAGLYQCLFMAGVPNAAAVDESVKLCRDFKKSSASGLVNAVLRKAQAVDLGPEIEKIEDPALRLSVEYALHPDIVALLLEQYGEAAEPIMAGLFTPRRRVVRVNTLKTDPQSLAQALEKEEIKTRPAEIADALEVVSGRYLETEAFREGLFRPQSLAAQLAVWALGLEEGQTLYDLCAAPGGKTLTAAQIMKNSGKIFAFDKSESRLKLVLDGARKEDVSIVEIKQADTASTAFKEPAVSRVLCDVPCSGLGEIAAKPELRSKSLAKIAELPPLQQKILQNGADSLERGGRLVYSTCTFNKHENIGVVENFLAQNREFRLVDPKLGLEGLRFYDDTVNFLPNNNDSEGFFIATFERI